MKVWITQGEMAEQLGVSIPTLYRWREANHLELGKHYRRKTPKSRILLYNKDETEKRINRLCTTPIEA
jgi:excisionase family DNA binding protein